MNVFVSARAHVCVCVGVCVWVCAVRCVCIGVGVCSYVYVGRGGALVKSRGVQYVHWVMHKCIMVKVGGKRNTRKVCKTQVNLSKIGRKICQRRGK